MILQLLNIRITKLSIIVSILTFIVIMILYQGKKIVEIFKFKDSFFVNKTNFIIFIGIILFIFKLCFTVFYIQYLPYGTDLGHHAFWAKHIITTGNLPDYQSNQFVIGESILLAMPFLISEIALNSVYSLILLFSFYLLGAMGVLILSFRLFNCKILPSLMSFLLITIPYNFLPPHFNFIISGVVGNLLGNFISIGFIYFLYRFITEKKEDFGLFTLISLFGLVYVHSLTTLLFTLIFLLFLIIYFLFSHKNFILSAKSFLTTLTNKKILILIILILSLFFLMKPAYLVYTTFSEVFTGALLEAHQGLDILNYLEIIGNLRVLFGIGGIILLYLLKFPREYKLLFTSWLLVLFVLSFLPETFNLGLPSSRIANYLIYPFAILGGFFLYYLVKWIEYVFVSRIIYTISVMFIILLIFSNSLFSSDKYFEPDIGIDEIQDLYDASYYLQGVVQDGELVLTDHIYVKGDSWIKFFLNKEYDDVLFRTFPFRYEPPYNLDTCPRDMVISPLSSYSQKCFLKYNVKYILLANNHIPEGYISSAQFEKVYSNNHFTIFLKFSTVSPN